MLGVQRMVAHVAQFAHFHNLNCVGESMGFKEVERPFLKVWQVKQV